MGRFGFLVFVALFFLEVFVAAGLFLPGLCFVVGLLVGTSIFSLVDGLLFILCDCWVLILIWVGGLTLLHFLALLDEGTRGLGVDGKAESQEQEAEGENPHQSIQFIFYP